MTVVCVDMLPKQDAENALADLWCQVEFYELGSPRLLIQFEKSDKIKLVVISEGSMLADGVLRVWATNRGESRDNIMSSLSAPRRIHMRRRSAARVAGISSKIGPVNVSERGAHFWRRGADRSASSAVAIRPRPL
jgi:hypothetical protein